MYLLILMLLLAVGESGTLHWRKLTCPQDLKTESTLRVWCRQSSKECCIGLPFSQDAQSPYGGKLRVTQDSQSFTVEVLELIQGEGMYWCGVLSGNKTFTKLAEGYFYSSPISYVWSFSRWIVLLLLPLVTIITSMCLPKKRKSPKIK
ncbi:uncharacterized protein si:ch211-102c2.4 isoform X2 [Mugil cephalus]|uniref:uncharacterized protein si:ch211-102c2.4 isoform X2 n=1 Tax=Mugil cephalus TaxID=48193 RepID=UPI001FB7297B|nr:uncharacterized protein si:ch211-102c2.4 isoform X2 [Mugil cephalus]